MKGQGGKTACSAFFYYLPPHSCSFLPSLPLGPFSPNLIPPYSYRAFQSPLRFKFEKSYLPFPPPLSPLLGLLMEKFKVGWNPFVSKKTQASLPLIAQPTTTFPPSRPAAQPYPDLSLFHSEPSSSYPSSLNFFLALSNSTSKLPFSHVHSKLLFPMHHPCRKWRDGTKILNFANLPSPYRIAFSDLTRDILFRFFGEKILFPFSFAPSPFQSLLTPHMHSPHPFFCTHVLHSPCSGKPHRCNISSKATTPWNLIPFALPWRTFSPTVACPATP